MTGAAATTRLTPPDSTPARRLIVNADDFALSPGVTTGILEAHTAGIVTSTSMMVRCPGWHDGVSRVRATPRLGVGLHFNLLVGAPLTLAPSLTRPNGDFLSLGGLALSSVINALSTNEIAAECEAQLAALKDAGIRVTHIDSHRHTHALPVVCRAVAAVATAHRLPLRRPVETRQVARGNFGGRFRAGLVARSWRLAARGGPAVRAPDHIAGLSLRGGPAFAADLARLVDTLPEGTTELVVHPGYADRALKTVDGYTAAREIELRALTDPELAARLDRRGVTLIGFGAL